MLILIELRNKFKYNENFYSKVIYRNIANSHKVKFLKTKSKKYAQEIFGITKSMSKNDILLTTIHLCPNSDKELNKFIDTCDNLLNKSANIIFIYDPKTIIYHDQIDKKKAFDINKIHLLYEFISPLNNKRYRSIYLGFSIIIVYGLKCTLSKI